MRLARKLNKKSVQYDTKKPFQPVSKPVRKTSEKLFGGAKFTTASNENVN